jgi:hypothetical protein
MGLGKKAQLEPSYSLVCLDEVGGVSNQTKHAKRSVAFSQLCQGTFIGCRRRQNALGNFSALGRV